MVLLSPQKVIDTLSNYSTCDVSDALVKFGFSQGGNLTNLAQISPEFSYSNQGNNDITRTVCAPTTVGIAYTVLYVLKESDPCPQVKLQSNEHYIDMLPPRKNNIIFISSPIAKDGNPVDVSNALYGGLMTARACHVGAEATIVDGRIRDLIEHRIRRYKVWSRGPNYTGSASPNKVARVAAVNVPIKTFSSPGTGNDDNQNHHSIIYPGDYIVADLNGVVVVPALQRSGPGLEFKRIQNDQDKNIYKSWELPKSQSYLCGQNDIDKPIQHWDLIDDVLNFIPKQVAADQLVAADIDAGKKAGPSQKHRRQNL